MGCMGKKIREKGTRERKGYGDFIFYDVVKPCSDNLIICSVNIFFRQLDILFGQETYFFGRHNILFSPLYVVRTIK